MIVMHHYVVNSGLLSEMCAAPTSFKSIYLFLMGMWGKTIINCFVLITGYFMCTSRITLHKFVKLLFQLVFYNLGIGLIFLLSGKMPITLMNIVNILNPIQSVDTGFVSCFLLFYLFIPFLNRLLQGISKQQHLFLGCLGIGIYTVIGTNPVIHVAFNYITWFSVLYVVIAYIRFYGIFREQSVIFWGGATVILILLSVLSVLFLLWFQMIRGREVTWEHTTFFVTESNRVLAFLVSLSSFMFFKNLHVPQNKSINTIAACSFGVLLIHAHSDTMRTFLWHDVFRNVEIYHTSAIYWQVVLVPIVVFSVCVMIDYARIRLIENVYLDKLVSFIQKNRHYCWLANQFRING